MESKRFAEYILHSCKTIVKHLVAKNEAQVQLEPPFKKISNAIYIAHKTSASTALATKPVGKVGHFVHISAFCSLSFNARLVPAMGEYSDPTCVYIYIMASSAVVSRMKELPVCWVIQRQGRNRMPPVLAIFGIF